MPTPANDPDAIAKIETQRAMALAAARFAPGLDRPVGDVAPDLPQPARVALVPPSLAVQAAQVPPQPETASAAYAVLSYSQGGAVTLHVMRPSGRKAATWSLADPNVMREVLAAFKIRVVDLT